MNIEQLRTEARTCTRCVLAQTRQHVVVGDGPVPAKLAFLGEGPGASEDAAGTPYAGRSGVILDEMLALIGASRRDVYVTNVLMCRPPGNRTPEAAEIDACSKWLLGQIKLVRPLVLVTFGSFTTGLFSKAMAPRRVDGRTIPGRHFAKTIAKPEAIRIADHRLFLYPLTPPWLAADGILNDQLKRYFLRLPELLERDLPPEPGVEEDVAQPRIEAPQQTGLFGFGDYEDRP